MAHTGGAWHAYDGVGGDKREKGTSRDFVTLSDDDELTLAPEAPRYKNKKELRTEVKRVKELLMNRALNKTLEFFKELCMDDEVLEHLPLKALRFACDARGVSNTGKRPELIHNIERSVMKEIEEIRREEQERLDKAQRVLTSKGSVRVFGSGNAGQLGTGQLGSSAVPIVILQMRNKGFRRVYAALDCDVFMAQNEDMEVVVWGQSHDVPMFGTRPKDTRDHLYLEADNEKLRALGIRPPVTSSQGEHGHG
eukprot:g4658.t1